MRASHDLVVCFDLDDTLYKEINYVRSGYAEVARLMCDSDNAFAVMMNAGRRKINAFDAMKRVEPGFDIDKAVQIYRSHVPDIRLPKETRELLESLQQRGIPMYIITDGRTVGQTNKYRSLGLDKYIPEKNLIISEVAGVDKHSPDNFLEVMHREGVTKRYVYVGDNPEKDFLHPNRLGWTTIMLRDAEGENTHAQVGDFPQENYARYVVDNITDVEKLLLM